MTYIWMKTKLFGNLKKMLTHDTTSVRNNECIRDISRIPGHSKPPWILPKSFRYSACSVTNRLTSYKLSRLGGFKKFLYPQTSRNHRCASVGEIFFALRGFFGTVSGNSSLSLWTCGNSWLQDDCCWHCWPLLWALHNKCIFQDIKTPNSMHYITYIRD